MKKRICVSVLVFVLGTLPALAMWTSDPGTNTPLVVKQGNQVLPLIQPIPEGGWYLAWQDRPVEASGFRIFLQRLDITGFPVWPGNGLLIAAIKNQGSQIVDLRVDASGNALLAFLDDRLATEKITVAKISPDREFLWGSNGIQIGDLSPDTYPLPKITPTSDGFVVVTWSMAEELKIRRLTSGGETVWTQSIPALPRTINQNSDLIASDNGSVILVWVRQQTLEKRYLMTQKILPDGNPAWAPAGLIIFNQTSLTSSEFPKGVSDGQGGVVFVWKALEIPACLAQRVIAAGSEVFTHNGIAASTDMTSTCNDPAFLFDQTGQSIVTYWRKTYSIYEGISGQKFDALGNLVWGDQGITVREVAEVSIASNSTSLSGGLVFWLESAPFQPPQLFGVRLDGDGDILCSIFGVSTVLSPKANATVGEDGRGMSVLVWEDGRDVDPSPNVYGQNVNADCSLGLETLRPREVSPPGTVQPLHWTNRATLAWEARELSGADTFNLYRGDIEALALGTAGDCAQSGLVESQATEAPNPDEGQAHFYLVGGRNIFGDGPLGWSSAGSPRISATPCP